MVGDVLRKSMRDARTVEEGCKITSPELSKCDVRGAQGDGMGSDRRGVGDCWVEYEQLAGILCAPCGETRFVNKRS